MDWKNKKVLVDGSEGLIGKELVKQLKELGANVYRFDIKLNPLQDVTLKSQCRAFLSSIRQEYVFHLFGIKGSPIRTNKYPVDFMYPMIVGDANMIKLANDYGVKKFLYTSSIAVLN